MHLNYTNYYQLTKTIKLLLYETKLYLPCNSTSY